MQTFEVVVTVEGDAQEENPTKALLKSLDLVLCGLRGGSSWDPGAIICCLWLLFSCPDRGGKVDFPPACSLTSGSRVGERPGSAQLQGWAPHSWVPRSAGRVAKHVFPSSSCDRSCFSAISVWFFDFILFCVFASLLWEEEMRGSASNGFFITLCTLLSWKAGPSEASFLPLFHVKSPVWLWSKAGPGRE